MNSYLLSEAADADIQHIFTNSVAQWGQPRAEQYVLELHEAFETLSVFPHLGRDIGYIRTGYLRFDHERHAVFFQKTADGIVIIRVLHQRQQHADYL